MKIVTQVKEVERVMAPLKVNNKIVKFEIEPTINPKLKE